MDTTASSDYVQLQVPGMTEAVTTGQGTWEESFDLSYYTEDFSRKLTTLTGNLGDTLYARVTFSGNNIPLEWFVKECTLEEDSYEVYEVNIIEDSCYSEFLGVKFRADDGFQGHWKNKIVKSTSSFQ